MKLSWLGHSSFLMESSNGTKIVTDPFPPNIGYPSNKISTDLVTISHHHFDHNYKNKLNKNCNIIDTAGVFNYKDIKILGIKSYHDKLKGMKRGENIIFKFNIDGYNICHLGDLGHILDDNYLDILKNINILLIPVGGNFTLNGKEAAFLCKKISSNIIIPMHFKTDNVTMKLDGIEKFLYHTKNNIKVSKNFINIDKNISGKKNLVYILKLK